MNYKDLGTPYQTERLQLYNCDCMELLRQTPDNYYQLCIVDPPYGIGMSGGIRGSRLSKAKQKNGKTLTIANAQHKKKNWDNKPPDPEYFKELRRVSKNQIVWGGNYFIDMIKTPSPCWLVWDKINTGSDQSDCEIAWTNFKTAVRKFDYMWNGMLQGRTDNGKIAEGDKTKNEARIHPTQKPVALYRWLLSNYAKAGDKILDTHLGSMSHAIAAHYAGLHLTGCELDQDYYAAGIERVKRETAQMDMFADAKQIALPEQLFLDSPRA